MTQREEEEKEEQGGSDGHGKVTIQGSTKLVEFQPDDRRSEPSQIALCRVTKT